MSIDGSLKGKSSLERHRNVLRRDERVVTLEDNEKWSEGKSSVFGLVKVAHRKLVGAKKAPKAEEAADGTAAVAAPAGKAGAPAAKGAAPAAGKGAPAAKAAPAAKGKK